MPLSLRPLSHSLGAEVLGVNVGGTLTNAEFDQIHRAFLDHGILLFRDQKITREQHIAFSRRFGELDDHSSLPRDRHPDYPELLLVTNIPEKEGHPETGRKALYIGDKVSCLVGMTPEESKPLIDFLVKHATRPQFVYRHQWRQDDIVFWDNRCTMHIALGDYEEGEIRHLERTAVKGAPSGYYLQ